MSLPGTGKNFEQFRIDDAVCRQFAYEQVGGATGQQAAQDAAVEARRCWYAPGCRGGCGYWQCIGRYGCRRSYWRWQRSALRERHRYQLFFGLYYESQRRYDHAYLQCMYAKGNRIPAYGRFTSPASPAWSRSGAAYLQAIRRLQRRPGIDRRPTGPDNPECVLRQRGQDARDTGGRATERERRTATAEHPSEAILLAKRFQKEFGNADLHLLGPDGEGVLTISGGLASFPRDGATVEQLFERADLALRDAKGSGKNRIYLVGEPQSDIADIE